jgi:hypothetical protein
MQRIPPLTMYRVEVAGLLDAGEPLSDVEEGIGRITDLTQAERAALRRFAGDAADSSAPSSSQGSRSKRRTRGRKPRAAVGRSEGERTSMERYRRSPRPTGAGPGRTKAQPHSLEFDESGFPIDPTDPGFFERLGRLLGSA